MWRPYCSKCGAPLGRENERGGVMSGFLPIPVETSPLENPVPDFPPRTGLLLVDHAAELARADEETPASEVAARATEEASEAGMTSDAMPPLMEPTASNRWWLIVGAMLALMAIPGYLHWKSRSDESGRKTAESSSVSMSSAQVTPATPTGDRPPSVALPEQRELPPRKKASIAKPAAMLVARIWPTTKLSSARSTRPPSIGNAGTMLKTANTTLP